MTLWVDSLVCWAFKEVCIVGPVSFELTFSTLSSCDPLCIPLPSSATCPHLPTDPLSSSVHISSSAIPLPFPTSSVLLCFLTSYGKREPLPLDCPTTCFALFPPLASTGTPLWHSCCIRGKFPLPVGSCWVKAIRDRRLPRYVWSNPSVVERWCLDTPRCPMQHSRISAPVFSLRLETP